jgi:hypothetical protein
MISKLYRGVLQLFQILLPIGFKIVKLQSFDFEKLCLSFCYSLCWFTICLPQFLLQITRSQRNHKAEDPATM